MKIDKRLYILIAFSIVVSAFYYFRIHLAADTIILFLASKLYLGKWLLHGVFPLYNPDIFAGTPLAFDLGMNNFHPFNLLFMLPYPLSFALWVGVSTMLFLTGFYQFFSQLTKTRNFALLLTLILFFSGSGLIRMTNAIVYSVICHMGLFFYSLSFLKSKHDKKMWLIPYIAGVLLTLSGHIQIVIYSYLLGLFIVLYIYKIPLGRVMAYYACLALSVSWYFLLSLPLALSSTRLTMNKEYLATGNVMLTHLLNIFFPFIFGEIHFGSVWNKDVNFQITVSQAVTLLLIPLFIQRKIKPVYTVLTVIFLILALGIVSVPFLRGAVQNFIPLHIILLLVLAQNEAEVTQLLHFRLPHRIVLLLSGILIGGIVFFTSPLFPRLFSLLYRIAKHGATSLYYDAGTMRAIGSLFAHSIFMLFLGLACIFVLEKTKKYRMFVLTGFVCLEGMLFLYMQTFFIPTALLASSPLPASMNVKNYRVQTTADTIPYYGFFTYQENVQLRPPFSKEKPLLTQHELDTFDYLRTIQSTVPSSWSMVEGIQAVQGYATFVPQKVRAYFGSPSPDYRKEYQYIIDRNPLFGLQVNDLSINSIETSRITMYDPRWQELGVRYFISDRPLRDFSLIAKDGSRYFYENPNAPSLYRIIDPLGNESGITPVYTDPNKMVFNLSKKDLGKKLVIIMNPDGFIASMNGKKVPLVAKGFTIAVPMSEAGRLTVEYSPVYHLQQTLQTLIMNKE